MLTDKIKWLGHASFRVDGSKTIYFDPFKIDIGKKADIIFISHKHYDHCSKDDVNKILKEDTKIVTEAESAKILGLENMIIVKPYDKFAINGLEIEALPAYNVNKPNHPKENGWLGFLVKMDGITIYHAGDTDLIEEMKKIEADVALIPVFPDDKYVMNPKEAAKATFYIKSRVFVPMHYGSIGGSVQDAQKMKEHANPKSIVTIMEVQKNSF